MTVYVSRHGRWVDKRTGEPMLDGTEAGLLSPRVSRFEEMESPVTGKTITSWRERDADMKAADAVDMRDLKGHEFSKGRKAQYEEMKNGRRSEDAWR